MIYIKHTQWSLFFFASSVKGTSHHHHQSARNNEREGVVVVVVVGKEQGWKEEHLSIMDLDFTHPPLFVALRAAFFFLPFLAILLLFRGTKGVKLEKGSHKKAFLVRVMVLALSTLLNTAE